MDRSQAEILIMRTIVFSQQSTEVASLHFASHPVNGSAAPSLAIVQLPACHVTFSASLPP